jgi:bifunctional DNase/RNase
MKDVNDAPDMIEAEIWTINQTDQGNAVMLRPFGEELVVPVFVGPLEAQSIVIGLDHIMTERPLTHDLFLSFMEKTGYTMLNAEVSDLKDNVFYSRVCFGGPNHPAGAPLVLDARPSDALALAVRAGCPILIARKVLKQAGIMPDAVSDFSEMEHGLDLAGMEPLQSLRQELDKAVGAEDYERAAKIRDKLTLLANGKKNPG